MTSPSLKNHQTTAQRPATRSEKRSLWKQILAGALCLCVAGAIPANDREGGKPLERLKQRSARQRWRELRGDWQSPPETTPAVTPAPLPEKRTPASRIVPRPIPTPSSVTQGTSDTPAPFPVTAVPVPEPIEIQSVAPAPATVRNGAKPPADPLEPLHHLGSFGEMPSEIHVATPRERTEIQLPHWPFQDDLDLVDRAPFAEATDVSDAARSTPVAQTAPITTSTDGDGLPELSSPIQVADVPAGDSSAIVAADPVVPEPVAEEAPTSAVVEADVPAPQADLVHQLKSIRDIQPFFNYAPNGGDPNEILCPRPAGSDPSKTYKQCPEESSLVENGSLERNHAVIPVYWQAANVYHNPLYFEDPGLERTGHTFPDAVQPFVSVGKFGAQVAALPYSIALDPMWQHETPLGHYRPGECAPKRHLAVPLNKRALGTAAATYTGLIFLFP